MTAGRRHPREMIEEGFQQRGLAAAGRADHVDAEDARGIESPAVLGRELIVGFEDALGSDEFHGSSPFSCQSGYSWASVVHEDLPSLL